MARGWESKAVAEQMEQTDVRAPEDQFERPALSNVERSRRERLEYLNLSRSRTLAQLERAEAPAHREMLQRTLRALEAELAGL